MKEKNIKLTDADLEDTYAGFVIAMKELDKYKNGSDRLLADRLEKLLKRIEVQASDQTGRNWFIKKST